MMEETRLTLLVEDAGEDFHVRCEFCPDPETSATSSIPTNNGGGWLRH
jgi:hypothetical protein